ncbi:hypothetical protein GCM10009660_07910 [Catellatospora bangladeshensis]
MPAWNTRDFPRAGRRPVARERTGGRAAVRTAGPAHLTPVARSLPGASPRGIPRLPGRGRTVHRRPAAGIGGIAVRIPVTASDIRWRGEWIIPEMPEVLDRVMVVFSARRAG